MKLNAKIAILFFWVLLNVYTVKAVPFRIIGVSSARTTTHQITSGSMTIGITDLGGGIINQVLIPGIGDIMDAASDMYGRAGQTAIRDGSHGGRYNPTQAGFNETLGTQCEITNTTGKLVVEPHGLALWHGDGQYDFTRWENIGPDPYDEPTKHGGVLNASDEDGLDEENLSVNYNGVNYTKQEAEVYSEWDYYGTYEDYKGKNGITTSAIRHYFEFRFIRPPGHCINQFRTGTSLWNGGVVRADISHNYPIGIHKGTDKDMNGMIAVWSLRHDRSKWIPNFVYYRNKDKTWGIDAADNGEGPNNDGTVFINADSDNPDTGKALGLYRPKSDINNFMAIGVNEKTGNIVYKDDRMVLATDGIKISHDMYRIPTMSKYGFGGTISGMINRTRLEADVYEAFRSEYFIFYGTPNEIMAAVAAYEANQSTAIPATNANKPELFEIQLNTANKSITIKLDEYKQATLNIYNSVGKLQYSSTAMTDAFSVRENELGTKGVLLVEVNGETKKTILH